MAARSSSAPTSVMLSIPEKKTIGLDLYRPIRDYISFNYSEREAQNVEDDLQVLKQDRSDLERQSVPSHTSRRDLIQRYYRSLCSLETRFPISPDKDHINTVTFTWYDAFKPKQKASQQSIHFEKAAVLFNLAAVYSQIGLSVDRTTVEGRREASHAFIASAGAFAYLRDNVAAKASAGSSVTMDLSTECAGMLERFMLAQAQECVFENAIAKGSTNGVCAKISRQVGLYYEDSSAALSNSPLKDNFDKSWVSHFQLKAFIFYAEACYRYSLELHEKEEIAEEIARLKSGISALASSKKYSKGPQVLDIINKLEADLNCNLERAIKENDRVYLMRVPNPNSLSPLPAISLVKPLCMDDILDASKERLFSNLVPDSSAKVLSRYTEMVDEIIRVQTEKLQQGSEVTRVKLKEMDLPDSILALEGRPSIGSELKEEVEAVHISGGPLGLESELQQLKDLRAVNNELLVQTDEILHKEAAEDTRFRSQFGSRWTRPQSSTLTKNLQDRLNKFASNLKQAADSDTRIERSIIDSASLMSILDRHPIESALPTLNKPLMSLDANEDAALGALKHCLRQLEVLGAQRASLEDTLKEMKRKDDILPKLMAFSGSHDELFKKEIAKYDPICQEIAENIEAQEQLLLQIQTRNEEFAALFNLEDYKASYEKCCKQIRAAIARYQEIKQNINEGMRFYVTLQEAITNIKQQCSDFVMTRNIQCQDMVEDMQKQMAGMGFHDRDKPPFSKHTHRPSSTPSHGPPHQLREHLAPPQSTVNHHLRPPYHQYNEVYTRSPPPGSSPYTDGTHYHPRPVGTPSHGPPPGPYQQPIPPQQLPGPTYGQPYYNYPSQQHGSLPQPPYTVQPPYYPHSGGYYKQ